MVFIEGLALAVLQFQLMHKNYNTPSKILDEYLELARNKAMKTRASRVNAIFDRNVILKKNHQASRVKCQH
jgi:hypothetical protein